MKTKLRTSVNKWLTNLLVILLVSFITLSVLSMSSCTRKVNESKVMPICAVFSIPTMVSVYDWENECELIDTDSYGRMLYRFTSKEFLSETEKSFFVICQSYGDDFVSFYEDVNYIDADASEDDLDEWRNINDWDKEIVDGKAAVRKVLFDVRGDYHVKYEKYKFDPNHLRNAIQKDSRFHDAWYQWVDVNSSETYVLYLVAPVDDSNETEVPAEYYLCLIDRDYRMIVSDAIDMTSIRQEIHDFKLKNGWWDKESV